MLLSDGRRSSGGGDRRHAGKTTATVCCCLLKRRLCPIRGGGVKEGQRAGKVTEDGDEASAQIFELRGVPWRTFWSSGETMWVLKGILLPNNSSDFQSRFKVAIQGKVPRLGTYL